MPIENIKENRLKKLAALRRAGVNPYPAKTKRTHTIEEALADFEKLSRAKTKVILVGRIRSIRGQGALTFLHFEDGTAKIQAFLKKDQRSFNRNMFGQAVDVEVDSIGRILIPDFLKDKIKLKIIDDHQIITGNLMEVTRLLN